MNYGPSLVFHIPFKHPAAGGSCFAAAAVWPCLDIAVHALTPILLVCLPTAAAAVPAPVRCWPGMGCRVHNAVLKSSKDGQATDVFWVTDLRGRKVGPCVVCVCMCVGGCVCACALELTGLTGQEVTLRRRAAAVRQGHRGDGCQLC